MSKLAFEDKSLVKSVHEISLITFDYYRLTGYVNNARELNSNLQKY